MTLSDLEIVVAQGEGSNLEFKNRTPEPEKIAREMVALANSGSGKILIGVDDDGIILGVKDTLEEEYAVRKAAQDWVLPALRWNFRRVQVSRKREVLVLSIPTGRSGPHFVRNSAEDDRGIMYVRFGDESVVASPEAYMIATGKSEEAGGAFEFGPDELIAMGMLDQNDRLTVRDFSKRVRYSNFKARKVLVALTLGGVLQHVISRPDDYFVVVPELLQ